MRVAVDVSASGARDGIGRYLAELLPRLIFDPATRDWQWKCYGRSGDLHHATAANVTSRADHLPRHLGRVLSLATTQPLWLARDQADVYWGPAHRAPVWVPASTARVVTIHDLCWLRVPRTMRRLSRWLDATLMPRAIATADRIIAVSAATRDELCSAFPAHRDRVVVIHEAAAQAPAPGPIDALSQSGLAPGYVLFVGTLEPRKNLHRLLQAFALALPQLPGTASLAIAGPPGWGRDDLRLEASRLGLADRVRWLGRVDDQQLSTLYRHAACLAMPSLYEGFGLPLLEALALGTPVLTSNTSSMPEVAGDAGVLVDPTRVDSIADGLVRILGDHALRARLGAHAKAQASRFSWDRAARQTLAVFEAAVATRREKRAGAGSVIR